MQSADHVSAKSGGLGSRSACGRLARRRPGPFVPTRAAARQRGVAAIEMALVLPILLAIAFGITELGRAMYYYDTLTKSARAAARYLVVYNAAEAFVQEQARCLAVYGRPITGCDGAGLAPVVPGLRSTDVQVFEPVSTPAMQAIDSGRGTFDMVAVSIGPYQFQSYVSFVVPSIRFAPISASMPQSFF